MLSLSLPVSTVDAWFHFIRPDINSRNSIRRATSVHRSCEEFLCPDIVGAVTYGVVPFTPYSVRSTLRAPGLTSRYHT